VVGDDGGCGCRQRNETTMLSPIPKVVMGVKGGDQQRRQFEKDDDKKYIGSLHKNIKSIRI
jgi:hypothetical protein